ncbi:MAG: hypothetical protein R3B47_19830 [Bacteroidia bacterium]
MTVKLEQFYRLLWADISCQNVFFLHKEILLEKNSIDLSITDYYLQRIVLSNFHAQKGNIEDKLVFRKENQLTAILKKLKEAEKTYLNKERFDNFINKKFGKTINLAKKRIEDESILELIFEFLGALEEESTLLKVLKEYHIIPESISDISELQEFFETEFIVEIQKFLKSQNFSNLFLSVDSISHYYNSFLKESLLNGHRQNVNVLIDKDNFKSRIELFDKLYEIGILKGGEFKSYFECINCSPKTFNGFMTCDILPSKLKVKCPNCSKPVNFLVPYFILTSYLRKSPIPTDYFFLPLNIF